MDWIAAGSAFAGALVGVVVVILGFLIWDYFDRRKSATIAQEKPLSKAKDLHEDILERHLEELVVSDFDRLFPGWAIYSTNVIGNGSARPSGIRYPIRDLSILRAQYRPASEWTTACLVASRGGEPGQPPAVSYRGEGRYGDCPLPGQR